MNDRLESLKETGWDGGLQEGRLEQAALSSLEMEWTCDHSVILFEGIRLALQGVATRSLAAVQYGVHLNPHPGRSSLMGVMKGMMEYGSGFVVSLLIFVRI